MKSKPISLPAIEKQLTSYQRFLSKLLAERRKLEDLKPAKSIEDVVITEGLSSIQESINLVMCTIKERAAPVVKQWSTFSEISEGMTVKCIDKGWFGIQRKCSVSGIVEAISIDARGIALHLRQALLESEGQPVYQTNKEEFGLACDVLMSPHVQILTSSGARTEELRVDVFLPVNERRRESYFEGNPRLNGEPLVTIYRS